MGLQDSNKVFSRVLDRTEELDQLAGVIPDLSNTLLSKTKKAKTFLNKAEKAENIDEKTSHLKTATEAIQEGSNIMNSLADEAKKMAKLTEKMGEGYKETQKQLLKYKGNCLVLPIPTASSGVLRSHTKTGNFQKPLGHRPPVNVDGDRSDSSPQQAGGYSR